RQGLLQVSAKSRYEPIEALLKRQRGEEAAAVQRLDQTAQTRAFITEAQLAPAGRGGEDRTPVLRLRGRDPGLGLRALVVGSSLSVGLALQPVQPLPQLLDLAAQGLILGQERIDVGGDPPRLCG
ncbi:MAG: hypothetical protein RLZZ459_2382, partial [Cyanobacteriota bacterium]